jgi:hypothetical protein
MGSSLLDVDTRSASRLGLTGRQRFNGGYVQQAAPNRDFWWFSAGIGHGNIQTATH